MAESEAGIGNYGFSGNEGFVRPRIGQDGLTKRKEAAKDRAKLGH